MAPARLSRNARRRGAAMVEAVVVIPTFLILFAGSIFIWQLYTQKERVMADARYKLWTYSISENCGDQGDVGVGGNTAPNVDMSGSVSSSQWDNGNNGGADTSSGEGSVGSGGDTSILHKSLGSVSYQEQASVQAAGILGGFSSNVTTQPTMMCNEPPHNGNLFGLAKSAFDVIWHW